MIWAAVKHMKVSVSPVPKYDPAEAPEGQKPTLNEDLALFASCAIAHLIGLQRMQMTH